MAIDTENKRRSVSAYTPGAYISPVADGVVGIEDRYAFGTVYWGIGTWTGGGEVNTENKRRSVHAYTVGAGIAPVPDGLITEPDRYAMGGIYSGMVPMITASGKEVLLTGLVTSEIVLEQ